MCIITDVNSIGTSIDRLKDVFVISMCFKPFNKTLIAMILISYNA